MPLPVEESLVNDVLEDLPAQHAERKPEHEVEPVREARREPVRHRAEHDRDPEDERDDGVDLREEFEDIALEHPAALITNVALHALVLLDEANTAS